MSNKILLQPNPLQLIIWIPLARGLFLKSPETFREYFGCHNSFYIFATPRFQAIKLRNRLSFSYVQNILKDHLFKTSGLQFDNWLFGPKSSQDFRETGPRPVSVSNQGSNTIALKNESISLKQFGLRLINEGNNRIQVHARPTYAN